MKWDMAWKKVIPILKLKIKLPTFGRKRGKDGSFRRSKGLAFKGSLKKSN